MKYSKKVQIKILSNNLDDRNSIFRFIKNEQYNQYKALNKGVSILYTEYLLKTNESGLKNKLEAQLKSLEKSLQDNISKL